MRSWAKLHKRSSSRLNLNSSALFGLTNGGTAGIIWTYLASFIAFIPIILSMAEMASMYVVCLGVFALGLLS